MIKLINILNEIGDKSFPWKFRSSDEEGADYEFNTPKHRYAVGFSDLLGDGTSYDMLFTPVSSKGLDTKEGVTLGVMATVSEIAKDFIKRFQPEEVTIHPITRTSQDDPKRSRVYGYYLEKNLPDNYSLLKTGDSFRLIKK